MGQGKAVKGWERVRMTCAECPGTLPWVRSLSAGQESHKIKHLQGGAGRTAGTCRDRRKISSPARVAGTGYKGGQEKASEVWAMKRKRPRPSAKTEDEADRRFFNEQFQPVQQELAALVTEIRHIRLLWGNLTKAITG